MQRLFRDTERLCHALNQIHQIAHWDAIALHEISKDRSRAHSAHVRWMNQAANSPGISLAEAMEVHHTPFEPRPLPPDHLNDVLIRLQRIEGSIETAREAALAGGASLLDADEHKATTVNVVHQVRVAARLVSGLRHTLHMPNVLCADDADQLHQFGEWCGMMHDRLTAAMEVEAVSRLREHSAPESLDLRARRKERQEILEGLRRAVQRGYGTCRDALVKAGQYWDEQREEAREKSFDPDHSDHQMLVVLVADAKLTSNPPDYTRLAKDDRTLWAARVIVLAWVLIDPDACSSPIQLTAFQQRQWTGEGKYDPNFRPGESDEYLPLHVIQEALDAFEGFLDEGTASCAARYVTLRRSFGGMRCGPDTEAERNDG